MFKDVVSEKGLRKLNDIWSRGLQSTDVLNPSDADTRQACEYLGNRFQGRVNYDYLNCPLDREQFNGCPPYQH